MDVGFSMSRESRIVAALLLIFTGLASVAAAASNGGRPSMTPVSVLAGFYKEEDRARPAPEDPAGVSSGVADAQDVDSGTAIDDTAGGEASEEAGEEAGEETVEAGTPGFDGEESAEDLAADRPPAVTRTSFDERWIRSTDRIEFDLDRLPGEEEGLIAVVIGQADVTAGVTVEGTRLLYDPSVTPLPHGESEARIFLVGPAGDFTELDRRPLKVLTERGFQSVQISKRLNFGMEAKLNDTANLIPPPDPLAPLDPTFRNKFTDLVYEGGVQTRHVHRSFTMDGRFNVAGSSFREKTVRSGEPGAPKVDLTDYLLTIDSGRTNFQVGHISHGRTRNLVDGFGSRGVKVSRKFGDRLDLTLASMNATPLVGFENFFGLHDVDRSNLSVATLGVEAFPDRPGGLRLELMYMDGVKPAEAGFEVGTLADTERNFGHGISLFSSNFDDRVRVNAHYANSTFVNPPDPFLEQDQVVAAAVTTADDAFFAELSADILRDEMIGTDTPVNLTGGVSTERLDPNYKTLGSFGDADFKTRTWFLGGNVDAVTFQYNHGRTERNIDHVPVLENRILRSSTLSVGVGLRELFATEEKPRTWIPNVQVGRGQTHDFSANLPVDETGASLFDPTTGNIPDTVTRERSAGASWSGDRWAVDYRYAAGFVDNRQVGRQNADTETYNHSVAGQFDPFERLHLETSFDWFTSVDTEASSRGHTRNRGLSFSWAFAERWLLAGEYSNSFSFDSLGTMELNQRNLYTTLTHNFLFQWPGGRRLPVTSYLRHSLNEVFGKNRNMTAGGSAFDDILLNRAWQFSYGFIVGVF